MYATKRDLVGYPVLCFHIITCYNMNICAPLPVLALTPYPCQCVGEVYQAAIYKLQHSF